MKSIILEYNNKQLKLTAEQYCLFESNRRVESVLRESEEEFNPLGYANPENSSDQPEEIDIKKDCVLSFSKGNKKLQWPYLTLPAGYTCPMAKTCKTFASKPDKKFSDGRSIKQGKDGKFYCFSATAQARYPAHNKAVWRNFDLLREFKDADGMADLIIKSIKYHKIDKSKVFRIHEGGDFFSEEYLKAWIKVAQHFTNILFYTYTTSLTWWVKNKGSMPRNFKLIASMDDKNEEYVLENKLRYSVVVKSIEEAKELGLEVDVDDSVAAFGDKPFALVIHGVQPKGSDYSKAVQANKKRGDYDQIKKAKSDNEMNVKSKIKNLKINEGQFKRLLLMLEEETRDQVSIAVLLNSKNELALFKRSPDDQTNPNLWGLIGGGVDKGETPEEGLSREIKEEGGVELSGFTFVRDFKYDQTKIHVYAKVVPDDIKFKLNDEHTEYGWFSPQEFDKLKPKFKNTKTNYDAAVKKLGIKKLDEVDRHQYADVRSGKSPDQDDVDTFEKSVQSDEEGKKFEDLIPQIKHYLVKGLQSAGHPINDVNIKFSKVSNGFISMLMTSKSNDKTLLHVHFKDTEKKPIIKSVDKYDFNYREVMGYVGEMFNDVIRPYITGKKKVKSNVDEGVEYPLASSDLWWGDSDYKTRGGKIIYMTPDEFLSKAKPLELDDESKENINDLISHINSGRKLDPLTLYSLDKTDVRNSDGRHRAFAAKHLGIEKVPVLDFTNSMNEAYIKGDEQAVANYLKKFNYDIDDLSYLGSGDFGSAYSIDGENKVLKITSAKSEIPLAKQLMSMNIDGHVKIYDVDEENGFILMEELDTDSSIEDLWYQMTSVLESQGLPVEYVHNFDQDEYEEQTGEPLDDDALIEFMDGVSDVLYVYNKLGVSAPDVRPENLGYNSDGKIVGFDFHDRSIGEQKELSESIMLNEYPESFDINHFKSLTSFKDRIAYAKEHIKGRGKRGSSRIVLPVDNDKVLKIAMNNKGLAQNEAEVDNWINLKTINSEYLAAPVLDWDDDNFFYLEMKRVTPLTESTFRKVFGLDPNLFFGYLQQRAREVMGKKRHYNIINDKNVKQVEQIADMEVFKDLVDTYHDLEGVLDFNDAHVNNFGYYMEDGEPQLVMIDYGLTDDISKQYYR